MTMLNEFSQFLKENFANNEKEWIVYAKYLISEFNKNFIQNIDKFNSYILSFEKSDQTYNRIMTKIYSYLILFERTSNVDISNIDLDLALKDFKKMGEKEVSELNSEIIHISNSFDSFDVDIKKNLRSILEEIDFSFNLFLTFVKSPKMREDFYDKIIKVNENTNQIMSVISDYDKFYSISN